MHIIEHIPYCYASLVLRSGGKKHHFVAPPIIKQSISLKRPLADAGNPSGLKRPARSREVIPITAPLHFPPLVKAPVNFMKCKSKHRL
jgi:hypothetical protein